MGIIAQVGRRNLGVMTLIVSMYLLLTAGGISMVYPFLLMLSTATTTTSDMHEYRIVPAYYRDDNALYRKYLWLRYDTGLGGASARDYNRSYFGATASEFRADEYYGWGNPEDPDSTGLALPPAVDPADPDVRQRAADLDRFLKESVVLWPGPPLTETVTVNENGRTVEKVDYVRDPFGAPLDPAGLSTGLGNYYRTVGYIGAFYVGFSGPGRDEFTRFLERFYTSPDAPNESEVARISRLNNRHGRPYERWRQVRPGYDMPTDPSWSIIEGEYVQSDWLYYKAVWLSGAPVVDRQADPTAIGLSAHAARTVGQDPDQAVSYTDVLGRTHAWTEARSLRSLRPSQVMPDFWKELQDRYMDIDQFNLAVGLARVDWSRTGVGKPVIVADGRDVVLAKPLRLSHLGGADGTPETSWLAMLRTLLAGQKESARPADDNPADYRYLLPPRIDPAWANLTSVAGLGRREIARLNERLESAWLGRMQARSYQVVHLEPFRKFGEAYLSSRRPVYEPLAREWDRFVAGKVPAAMIQPIPASRDPTTQPTHLAPAAPRPAVSQATEERARLALDPAREHLRLPAHAWRDFLGWLYAGRPEEYARLYLPGKSPRQIAQMVHRGRMLYGPEFDQFNLAEMPNADRDVVEFVAHKGELRRHFMFGNFGVVLEELVLEGRAMFNTIVLVFLAIVTHVTVNPLAAYALSRFRLTYTYKVLLFMLATMAFPPAVGMIPSFLLLRNFGLINTYAALVLPGIASGYTIFLLKGFFDALPQELYEAAEIDGAGKISTFLNVTFPLSKPIFAIITLNSFTAAYSGFMWAFLICPDSRMWTLMVHLFNIQQRSTPPIAMAALVIAAVPTFLVFLFCQNVILRGIIIPSFK